MKKYITLVQNSGLDHHSFYFLIEVELIYNIILVSGI